MCLVVSIKKEQATGCGVELMNDTMIMDLDVFELYIVTHVDNLYESGLGDNSF